MIHVFLDTTTFREDPLRRKTPFLVIARLAIRGDLKMHISDISRREFISQQELEFDNQLEKMKSAFSNLQRKIPNDSLPEKLQYELDTLKVARNKVGLEFDEWLAKCGAKVHAIADNHATAVFDKYFSGLPPFAQAKSRNDIPDAFIGEVVGDVARSVESLHFVSGDSRLSAHLGAIGVPVHGI